VGILPICVVIALIVAALYLMARLDRARFERRFPPISDDEFMALCKPGTSREVALKVRRIVSQQLGVDYNRIYPSSSFVQDLGCD
jgi:hypothetical protein